MDKKHYLKVKEAAEYLGVNARTIMRYLAKKKIKATKVGHWRFYKEDLDKFLKDSANMS